MTGEFLDTKKKARKMPEPSENYGKMRFASMSSVIAGNADGLIDPRSGGVINR